MCWPELRRCFPQVRNVGMPGGHVGPTQFIPHCTPLVTPAMFINHLLQLLPILPVDLSSTLLGAFNVCLWRYWSFLKLTVSDLN